MVAAFQGNEEVLEISATDTSVLLAVIGLYNVSSIFCEMVSRCPHIYHLSLYLVLYMIYLLQCVR